MTTVHGGSHIAVGVMTTVHGGSPSRGLALQSDIFSLNLCNLQWFNGACLRQLHRVCVVLM